MDDLDRIVSAMVIRPGDKLVLQVPTHTSVETAQHIQDECNKRLPGVEVVIAAVDGMLVYPADPGE